MMHFKLNKQIKINKLIKINNIQFFITKKIIKKGHLTFKNIN